MSPLYNELMTDDYLQDQIKCLLARRASKHQIISQGGERAIGHSPSDIKRNDFALARIKSGQYGFCCHCGTLIGKARLAIIPETPFCAECAH